MTDDALLLKRAQRGDRAAVDAILREHHDTVRAVCHRIVIDRDDADDAVQNALISIVRALPSFDGRSAFRTWVYRIATNAALDEVRRIRRRAIPTDDQRTIDSAERDGTGAVDDRIDIAAAMNGLSEEHRVALVLRHVADLEYEEIAVILDVPVGTVRSRLSRAREQLGRAIGNPEPGR